MPEVRQVKIEDLFTTEKGATGLAKVVPYTLVRTEAELMTSKIINLNN